jgi:Helix-turn-helix domain
MSHLEQDDLMTASQAAKFLRVSPIDLRRAVLAGKIPYHRHHGRLWFSHGELLVRLMGMPVGVPRDAEPEG